MHTRLVSSLLPRNENHSHGERQKSQAIRLHSREPAADADSLFIQFFSRYLCEKQGETILHVLFHLVSLEFSFLLSVAFRSEFTTPRCSSESKNREAVSIPDDSISNLDSQILCTLSSADFTEIPVFPVALFLFDSPLKTIQKKRLLYPKG
jgi:hypothetical protein